MRKFVCIIAICVASFSFSTSFAKEPENIGTLKKTIIKYYESGEYGQDVTKVTSDAQNYLQTRIIENEGKAKKQKLAIVFDIDDTALTSYECAKKLNFGGTIEQIRSCIAEGTYQVIPQVLDLYRFAKAHNVAVFFITGRKQDVMKTTEGNLKHEGYNNWDGLYLESNDYKEKSAVPFKTNLRKNLIDQGYDIVFSMGDQSSDLTGGYADKEFKLPNPMYFVP